MRPLRRAPARFAVGQVAYRIGFSPQEYLALEAGAAWASFDVWDAMCKLYGWPQSFVAGA